MPAIKTGMTYVVGHFSSHIGTVPQAVLATMSQVHRRHMRTRLYAWRVLCTFLDYMTWSLLQTMINFIIVGKVLWYFPVGPGDLKHLQLCIKAVKFNASQCKVLTVTRKKSPATHVYHLGNTLYKKCSRRKGPSRHHLKQSIVGLACYAYCTQD